jgi:hypothetical protein
MGELVTVSDPMGYSGEGTVVRVQTTPHHAVFVHMHTITDRTDQSAVGREIWVLAGNIEVAP